MKKQEESTNENEKENIKEYLSSIEPNRTNVLERLSGYLIELENNQNALMYTSIGVFIAIVVGINALGRDILQGYTAIIIFLLCSICIILFGVEFYRRGHIIRILRRLYKERQNNKIFNNQVNLGIKQINKSAPKWYGLRLCLYILTIVVTLAYIVLLYKKIT